MPPKAPRQDLRAASTPPKTPAPRSDWKTEEQLEFLLAYWEKFKRAQDNKALDSFWPKVYEDWYTRWPISSSASLVLKYGSIQEGRLMLQKDKNAQIKGWFNNRCRGTDLVKGSCGDLKLDVNEKRKLAPLQAYCSYAWDSLRPIVLTRWEQQKKSDTFNDEEDPTEDDEDTLDEAQIPLSFKLKIAKELYVQLPLEEKRKIDARREEDKKKMYRRVTEIDDDEERYHKLRIHQRNQPCVVKSLNRVLANLEDQTGCVAQLIIASVNPTGGPPSIQKFCQGETRHGLKFETFYGDEWEANVEKKFREWAVRVFGEKGSERRSKYLLPKDLAAPSEASSPGLQTGPEAGSSQNLSAEATPSQISSSRPSKSRKPVARSSVPKPQPSVARPSLPMPISAPQASIISDPPGSTSTPTSNLPMPHASIDPLIDMPNQDEDMTLLATAVGVHQLLTQVAIVPQVVHDPCMITPGNLHTVEPSQLIMNPSQSIVEPSQSIFGPSQVVPDPSQVIIEPSQVIIEPSQVIVEPSQVIVEPSQVIVEPSQVIVEPSQPHTKVVNSISNSATPKVPYRVRNPVTQPSGGPSRRGSIDGAPEMIIDVIDDQQETVVDLIDDEEESTVDLRDYISMDSEDDESHISSSQKTADECRELSPPAPNSQQQKTSVGGIEGGTNRSEFASSRTRPQLDTDEGDLPAWMVKKGQWRYVASTAGGTVWENLLRLYMNQERRLEFTEMGAALTNEDRPSKIKEYFQYAHQPSRGDTLAVPGFGAEVAKWWERIQPEWRRSKQDLPQSRSKWSYILSGGSKGVFLVILCLAWWDRAYERHLEKEKEARRAEAKAAGIIVNFDDLPDHDAEWLKIVNDVGFVMEQAQNCDIPTRGMPSPSRKGKRRYQEDPTTPEQAQVVKRSSRKRPKV